MNFFDMRKLDSLQEIPQKTYRPIVHVGDYLYLEEVNRIKEDEWTNGIYSYRIADGSMVRLDQGAHVQTMSHYRMDLPYVHEMHTAMQQSVEEIFFSLYYYGKEYDVLNFYRIDLSTGEQSCVYSTEMQKDVYYYKGFELLTDSHLMMRLSVDEFAKDLDFQERCYLIDTNEKKSYLIKDSLLSLNLGYRILFGEEHRYMMLEERYLSVEEKDLLLLTDDLELTVDFPEDVDENFVYQNAVLLIELETLIQEIKSGEEEYSFEVLDDVLFDGTLQLVGETTDKIFYRTHVYEPHRRAAEEFSGRHLFHMDDIYVFDKTNHRTTFFAKINHRDKLYVTERRLCLVKDSAQACQVYDFLTKELLIELKKSEEQEEIEEFYAYYEGGILVTSLGYAQDDWILFVIYRKHGGILQELCVSPDVQNMGDWLLYHSLRMEDIQNYKGE